MSQIICANLWKVFGPKPQQVMASLNGGASKADVLAKSGHVVAVQDVSFEVAKGEIFVIMGLSGSGKSTLIRCLSRLIEPTSGSMLLDGEDVFTMAEGQLRDLRRHRLSMVFQHFGLFPHQQVIDNVAYGLEVQGVAKAARHERAKEVLGLVSLSGWEYHYPSELSGGMQQRVGIARALAVDPEILMFDEPFSALDPLIRRDMQDELIGLQKDLQKTILFITHDFLEAVKLGDRIAIMKDGQIVQIGTPSEIVLHPVNDYVRDFARDVPRANVLTASSILDTETAVLSEADLNKKLDLPIAFVKGRNGECLGCVREGDKRLFSIEHKVSPDTSLGNLLSQHARNPNPIPVIDANNKLLGTVDRIGVMMALSDSEAV